MNYNFLFANLIVCVCKWGSRRDQAKSMHDKIAVNQKGIKLVCAVSFLFQLRLGAQEVALSVRVSVRMSLSV